MIKYVNIDRKNNLIENSEDRKYDKNELIKLFSEFIAYDGFAVKEWINTKRVPYEVIISKDNHNYRIIMYLKNISGAGWKNKPRIRRVQVSNIRKDNIDNYIDTTDNETAIILGYYNFDKNPIMVAWNNYQYVYHETNRSCYVAIDNLLEGYKNNYVVTSYANQRLWIFTPSKFGNFLADYIKNNKVDD